MNNKLNKEIVRFDCNVNTRVVAASSVAMFAYITVG